MLNFFLAISLHLPQPSMPMKRSENYAYNCRLWLDCDDNEPDGEVIRMSMDEFADRYRPIEMPIKKYSYPRSTVWIDESFYRFNGGCITSYFDYGNDGAVDTYRTDCPGNPGEERPIRDAPTDIRFTAALIDADYNLQSKKR